MLEITARLSSFLVAVAAGVVLAPPGISRTVKLKFTAREHSGYNPCC
jgi:hypothetical protein